MSRNLRLAALLIALILSFVAEKAAMAVLFCVDNPTEDMTCNDQGLDCSCGGSGGGCSSCHRGGVGGGGGGSSDCVYNWVNQDFDCVYLN